MSTERQVVKDNDSTSIENEGWFEAFPDVLKELRENAGLSQSELARKIGVDHSTINRLESGERDPSIGMVEAIIGGLDLDEIQADRLRASAGFRGNGNTIPHLEEEMQRVNWLFNDPETPEDVKERMREAIAVIGSTAVHTVCFYVPENNEP